MPNTTTLPLPKAETLYSFAEYLKKEERSLQKHEFFSGKIFKMAGGKFRHNLVAVNVTTSLRNNVKRLSQKHYVLGSDQKIYVESEDVSMYPDGLAICGEPEYWNEREDIIVNPLVVVEVFSKSTQKFDKHLKFWFYKQIPSFKEYVLINPDKMYVEVWTQISKGLWQETQYTGPTDIVILHTLENTPISMQDIYDSVIFK